MWSKLAGPLAALLLLLVEIPVFVKALHLHLNRDQRLVRPFQLSIFAPTIVGHGENTTHLYKGDRVLAIDGHPIRNRSDLEEAMAQAEVRGFVSVDVTHYPEAHPPWNQTATATLVPAGARTDSGLWQSLETYAAFSILVWPAICLLLASAVLATNGTSSRAWLAAGALALLGHPSWLLVTPYAWPEPLRTAMVVYDAAIIGLGSWCLFGLLFLWPTPLWGRRWGLGLSRIALLWALFRILIQLTEKSSYAALEPFAFMDRFYGSSTYALGMIAGVFLSMRWTATPDRTLRQGMQIATFGLGALLIFLPWIFDFETVLSWHPVVWICLAASLAFPFSVALAGAKRSPAPLQLPACHSWPDLFAAARAASQASCGVDLLAIYAATGTEHLVRAADPGVHEWPPIVNSPPIGPLHWEAMPDHLGYLAFASSKAEGLAELAAATAAQAEHLIYAAS